MTTVKNIFDKIGDKGFVRTQIVFHSGDKSNLINIDGRSTNPYLVAPDEILPAHTECLVYNTFLKKVEPFYSTAEIKPAGIYLVVASPKEFPRSIIRKMFDKELVENSEVVLECRKIYVPNRYSGPCELLRSKINESVNRYDKRANYQWEVSHNSKGHFVPINSLHSSKGNVAHDGVYLILKGKFIFADPAHLNASDHTIDMQFSELAKNKTLLRKMNMMSAYADMEQAVEYFAAYFSAFHEKSPQMIYDKLLANPVIRILIESEETLDYVKKLKLPLLKSVTK